METITKHEFTKIFSQELKNAGFMPRKYCNMECADQILRCYYKTILKCLAAVESSARNYPFCSTCLFFKIYDFGYQTLFSGI